MPTYLKAVIATTISESTPIDPKRTQHIYSKEVVEEINKQVHLLKNHMDSYLDVLLQIPLKEYVEIVLPNQSQKNEFKETGGKIGRVVDSYLEQNNETGVLECIGTIEIQDEREGSAIENNKNDLCFFSIIAYSEHKSLQEIYREEDGKNIIYKVIPPIKIVGVALGTKRSSSNPYLRIL